MKTKRIYYGPEGKETSLYWTVKISPAKEPVIINGKFLHALRAHSGVTVGCSLSMMATDNANAFPHRVYLASFTKTTAVLVDRLRKDGSPMHAVVYAHSYGHITDMNDTGTLKRMVKEDPAIIERPFTLRPPRRCPVSKHVGRGTSPERKGHGMSIVPRVSLRGALRRAVKAGRIGVHVAQQIEDVASR